MGPRPGHNRGTNSDSENGKTYKCGLVTVWRAASPLERRQQKFYGTHNPSLIPATEITFVVKLKTQTGVLKLSDD